MPWCRARPDAGLDEAGVALGQGHGHAGGHQGPAPAVAQHDVLAGHQVDAGVAGPRVAGQGQVGVETDEGHGEHGRQPMASPPGRPTSITPMLAWMDLEMTGLDPARHVIVEIATLLTDDDLELVAEGPDLVVHATEAELAEMGEVVVQMHTRSGLLDQIQASTISLAEAGEATLAFLREHVTEPRSVPLCGNSIGTDRRFLPVHLPEIEEYLHYRSVDVSTLKELARRWNPAILGGAPRKAEGHRALDDIRESVEELRYYRETFLVGAPRPPIDTPAATPAG